jgi:hypothetical protein
MAMITKPLGKKRIILPFFLEKKSVVRVPYLAAT